MSGLDAPDEPSTLRDQVAALRSELDAALRAMEELAARSLALEEASEAKSTFLAVVSHEIRTQLSGIMGMTEAAMDTRLSPDQQEYLDLVRASGDALMTLVNDLLDLRKIEAGHLSLEDIPFNLRDALMDSTSVFIPHAQKKGLDLSLDISAGMPEFVSGDPGRLRQIITNLVSNAVKFTNEGSITIRASAAVEGEAADCAFIVEDTGIGMTREQVDSMFDEFAQGSSATARLYGGSGLGLAIARQLVDRMGGRISVESAADRGTSFMVELRFRLAPPVMSRPRLRRDDDLRGLPVLVLTGSSATQTSVKAALSVTDLALTFAGSLEEAIEALELARTHDAPFAAILLDEIADPIEAASQIRDLPRQEDTHIIVVTSVGERGDAARCRELRVAGYLTRPTAEELVEGLLAVLAGALPVDLTTLVTRHWLRERRKRLEILVVDDSPTNRMTARRLLETRGHTVYSVVTGREAVEATETFRFDVVVMDLGLPELDGLEAARRIRSSEAGFRVPIVGATTESMTDVESGFAEAGIDVVVRKPFEPFELSEAIHKVLA